MADHNTLTCRTLVQVRSFPSHYLKPDLDAYAHSTAEARKLMSDRALGYRPPPGPLAAMAQAAAAKHPDASAGVDPATLAQAALADAKRIAAERSSNDSASTDSSVSSPDPIAQLKLNTISAPDARAPSRAYRRARTAMSGCGEYKQTRCRLNLGHFSTTGVPVSIQMK